jgi:hypothetical protein
VVAVGEPGDVADLDQQPGGAGGADAVKIHQRAAGGSDQFGELFVRGLGPLVDALEVADQFGGHAARAFPAASRGRTSASSASACAAERVLLRTA